CPPPRSTLFPYTTLFRSVSAEVKAFGSDLFNGSLSVPPIGSDNWVSILDTDNQYFQDLARAAQFLASYNLSSETNGILSGGFKRSEEHTSELQSRENLVC